MSELPKGWISVPLGELGTWKGGGTPSKSNPAFWKGSIPWVSPKDMKSPEIHDTLDHISKEAVQGSATNLVPEDTLLVVNRSGILSHTFPVAITRREVSLNQDLKALVPAPDLSPKFLQGVLRSNGQRILTDCRKAGTTVASVDFEGLKAFEIGLPPLNEQRRIVAKLEKCEARVGAAREALDEVPKLLEQYRQSVLAAAFRGDLTRDWRAANPDAEPANELLARLRTERRQRWEQAELAKYQAKDKTPPKDWKQRYNEPDDAATSDLPLLPDSWRWVTLEEITTKITDGVHKKPKYVDSGVPFVTVKNMTAGPGLSFEKLNYITDQDHIEFCKRTNPEKGDILVSKDGTLGVIRRIDTDIEFSIFVSVALVKPVISVLGLLLEWALQSRLCQSEMKATGTGLMHIHLVDLRKVRVPLPPLEEQAELVKVVSDIVARQSSLSSTHSDITTDLTTLTQSLLAKAFRGELVPQDPNDEPASELLARLREQRATEVAAKKKPKRKAAKKKRASL